MGAKKMEWLDPWLSPWLLGNPFTDGACSDQGTPFARAGFGIYFYEKCSRNVALPWGATTKAVIRPSFVLLSTPLSDTRQAPFKLQRTTQWSKMASLPS